MISGGQGGGPVSSAVAVVFGRGIADLDRAHPGEGSGSLARGTVRARGLAGRPRTAVIGTDAVLAPLQPDRRDGDGQRQAAMEVARRTGTNGHGRTTL